MKIFGFSIGFMSGCVHIRVDISVNVDAAHTPYTHTYYRFCVYPVLGFCRGDYDEHWLSLYSIAMQTLCTLFSVCERNFDNVLYNFDTASIIAEF